MPKNINFEKFFYSQEVVTYAKTICDIASECWRLQLSDSTGFSISQVIPDTNIVLADKSGTGFRRNKIEPKDLILIDTDGNLLYRPDATNPRLAPVNVAIHLDGYRNSDAKGCIHWHDPFTNAFTCRGKTIYPLTLQSKLIGEVPCILVDDRVQKSDLEAKNLDITVPTGFHSRLDVYYVMQQVGNQVGQVLASRNAELQKHGLVITHYEHGLFSFGRQVDEAFENGYRSVRNAQTIIYSELLKSHHD